MYFTVTFLFIFCAPFPCYKGESSLYSNSGYDWSFRILKHNYQFRHQYVKRKKIVNNHSLSKKIIIRIPRNTQTMPMRLIQFRNSNKYTSYTAKIISPIWSSDIKSKNSSKVSKLLDSMKHLIENNRKQKLFV